MGTSDQPPRGIPDVTSMRPDQKPPIVTICFLPKRKDLIHDKRDPCMVHEKSFCSKVD